MSKRCTSKPRDFILAVMPQFSFYIVPKNAKKLSFQDLFIDCTTQLRTKTGSDLAPLFIDYAEFNVEEPATKNIPSPAILGDLVFLLSGARFPSDNKEFPSLGALPIVYPLSRYPVSVQGFVHQDDMVKTLSLIQQCMRSYSVDAAMHLAIVNSDMTRGQNGMDDSEQKYLAPYLHLLIELFRRRLELAMNWHHFLEFLNSTSSTFGIDKRIDPELGPRWLTSLTLFAASFSVGFGVHAFRCIEHNQSPLLIMFDGQPILGLVANALDVDIGSCQFSIVGVNPRGRMYTRRWLLLASDSRQKSSKERVCLFPDIESSVAETLRRNSRLELFS